MARRRRINQIFDPVLSVEIAATKVRRLVYLLVANRPVGYAKDYSRIVYIGTTRNGVRRVAASASRQIVNGADELRGLRRLDAFVVWAKSKRGPQTKRGSNFWHVLERALLIRFKQRYGEPPALNGTGQRMKPKHEFDVFKQSTVDRIINRYS